MINRVVFLSVMAAIGVISATLCAPALPFIADHFSTQFSTIQFTISLFLVGNAFGQLISGPLSDQIGQRVVMLGGLLLYILASLSCAVAGQMEFLFMARFFQGMGSAVGPVLARAIANSSFEAEKSAQIQSYGAIGIGIASILSILGSGYLTLLSWRGNFWLATGLGIGLFFWARAVLPKTVPSQNHLSLNQVFSQMSCIVADRRFLAPALSHSMAYGLMYGYITLFPFLLERDPAQVGRLSAILIAFYMLGALIASRWVLRRPQQQLIEFGIALQLISGVLLLFFPLLLPLILFNVSLGVILPLTSASALSPFVQRSGAASSALGLSYRLIGSILSALICQFPLAGGRNLGFAILLLSMASWLCFRNLSRVQIFQSQRK